MKIPKCCKNCANKYRGACCCSLPAQCNEWVEDDESFDNKTITVTFNPDDTLVEQNDFKEIEKIEVNKVYHNDMQFCRVKPKDVIKKVEGGE